MATLGTYLLVKFVQVLGVFCSQIVLGTTLKYKMVKRPEEKKLDESWE